MTSHLHRLRLARAVLILSCVALVIAHLLPIPGKWWFPDDPPNPEGWRWFYFEYGWPDLWGLLTANLPKKASGFIIVGLFVCVWLIMASLPFLAGIFSKARWLWGTVTILVIAMAGRMLFVIGRIGIQAGWGGDVCLLGFGLAVLGLLLIPRHGAVENPGRWRIVAMTSTVVIASLLASPRIFRHQIDRAMEKERLERCRWQLTWLFIGLDHFQASTDRRPTNEEGWQALIHRPPGIVEDPKWHWEQWLKAPPIDPWGRPYRYTVSPRMTESKVSYMKAEAFSDGPDGIQSTADDLTEDHAPR